jgi:hypothetical protein
MGRHSNPAIVTHDSIGADIDGKKGPGQAYSFKQPLPPGLVASSSSVINPTEKSAAYAT